MESSEEIISALIVSSVAITIGIIMREVECLSLLPQSGSQIFSISISGDGEWWSLSPFLFVTGAVIGALHTGPAWRRFGNRLSMIFFDAILIIGLFAVTFPIRTTELMVAGRLLLGIGSGALSAIVPAYIGEISQPKFRGRLGVLFSMIMTTGVVISDIFGPFKQYDFQQPFNILLNMYCCSIVILHVIGLCFIPKSSYLSSSNFFQQNYSDDGSLSAISLLGHPYWTEVLFPRTNTDYRNEFRRSSRHIFDTFGCRADRRALLISVGCMFFHQMCGIHVMLSYMIHILKMADMNVDPKTVVITLGTVQVIMMCVTIIIVDNKGRRILLISSAVIMCLCLAGLAFCITIQIQLNAVTLSHISIILIMLFILAYSLGFGPVPWVIMGEIFSTKGKPYGISFTTAINWLMILAGIYFPYELNKFFEIEYVFFVHFVLCLLGALFTWWFVPETKKISLTQIQQEIDANFEVISYIPV